MIQLSFDAVPRFPNLARDMPMSEVMACPSEEEAVARSLDFAKVFFGIDRKTVQLHCGWRTHSYMSEILKPESPKQMPSKKLHLFCQATGCNLLKQYRELHAAMERGTTASVLQARKESVKRMVQAHDRRKAA